MSLTEIIGTPRYEVYYASQVNVPAPEYTAAVEQVRSASRGSTISRAATIQPVLAVPEIIPNILTEPLLPIEHILDLVNIITYPLQAAVGSREQKVESALPILPVDVVITPAQDIAQKNLASSTMPLKQFVTTKIDEQKQTSPEIEHFWEQPVVGTSDIEINIPEIPNPFGFLDDWGNTLKWAAIGIGALVGVYLIAKIIGGKR